MEASLAPRWWQKLTLSGAVTICVVVAVACYWFDPAVRDLGAVRGRVVSAAVIEHVKPTSFRQTAIVRLESGESVVATFPADQLPPVPVGALVQIHKVGSLLFRKRSFRAELIELRPNNSSKPTPLRGAA
jgi:hypothetical protein